jgi:hypothetical protein
VSDAASPVRDVVLLLQKDGYTPTCDALRPVNNLDVQACWQKSFRFHADSSSKDAPIVLANQLSPKGEPVPLASLFFCKTGQRFFHPPCPSCGSLLDLCSDDDLLDQSGLPAYSTSLNRYLVCPSCSASGQQRVFYTFQLSGWEAGNIKDWKGLVREYARLLEKGAMEASFPCLKCPKRLNCPAEEDFSSKGFVPFSFYPFFMLVFEKVSLNALDFIALLSDASLDQVQAGLRQNGEFGRLNLIRHAEDDLAGKTGFLFKGDERHFLEILYLKLSFLGELARSVAADDRLARFPDWRVSLDRTWVTFSNQAGLLPRFWNFSLSRMDIAGDSCPADLSLFPSAGHAIHYLGLACFYTLLTNRNQNIDQVYQALKASMENLPGSNDFSRGELAETFGPENIFWDPKGKVIEESWRPLWNDGLQLGAILVRHGEKEDPGRSMELFEQKRASLQERIKADLFHRDSAVRPVQVDREDEKILRILERLGDKWHEQDFEEEVPVRETVFLSSEEFAEEVKISPMLVDTLPIPGVEADLDETVIVSGKREAGEEPIERIEDEQGEGVPETVRFEREEVKEWTPPKRPAEPEEALPETLIISSGKEVSPSRPGTGCEPPRQAEAGARLEPVPPETEPIEKKAPLKKTPEEELLPETVIIGMQSKKGRGKEEEK